MRTGEFVPVFAEFVEVEADISNWNEPLRRFTEVNSKTERTSDEEATWGSWTREKMPEIKPKTRRGQALAHRMPTELIPLTTEKT